MTKYPPATDATPEELAKALLRRRPPQDRKTQEDEKSDVAAPSGQSPEEPTQS